MVKSNKSKLKFKISTIFISIYITLPAILIHSHYPINIQLHNEIHVHTHNLHVIYTHSKTNNHTHAHKHNDKYIIPQ